MSDPETNRKREDERHRHEALGPEGETRQEKEQKDLGILAALGAGAGFLFLASPIIVFGLLVLVAWLFIRGCH
jgi:hypothetical protein